MNAIVKLLSCCSLRVFRDRQSRVEGSVWDMMKRVPLAIQRDQPGLGEGAEWPVADSVGGYVGEWFRRHACSHEVLPACRRRRRRRRRHPCGAGPPTLRPYIYIGGAARRKQLGGQVIAAAAGTRGCVGRVGLVRSAQHWMARKETARPKRQAGGQAGRQAGGIAGGIAGEDGVRERGTSSETARQGH